MITRRELLESTAGSLALGVCGPGLVLADKTRGPAAATGPDSAFDSIVPRSNPPARQIIAANMHRVPRDEAIALAVMQGLINRKQPRVYYVYDVEDAFWLNWLRTRGDIDRVEWMGPYDVFRRFREQIGGCVVTDPALPATTNVAMLLGSINNWLAISPELVDTFGLPVREDLRGRWARPVDAYRWAYQNLFASANQQIFSHMSTYSSRLRDYMTAFKVFTFWLSGKEDENGRQEIELAREILSRIGPNKPVVGWWHGHGRAESEGISEEPGVSLISQYGLFTDCMDWDSFCEGTSNVSVHSGTRAVFRQKQAPAAPKIQNKVYYSFVRTDGDGTNFWRQEFLNRWNDAQHGSVPVNWPVGPMASDFIPDIMDWFYAHATAADYLMVAVSGIGYTRENVYGERLSPELREKSFDEFRRLTARYMKRMDLHHIHTHKTSSQALAEKYTHVEGLQGLFLNYDREPDTTVDTVMSMVNGVPVFRSVTVGPEVKGDDWAAKQGSAAEQIRRYTPGTRPAFLHVTLQNWCVGDGQHMETCATVAGIQKLLGPDYVPVRADHLAEMYRQSQARANP